jgi:DNA-directed RNA polymerase subunit RPC12/RpoP
MESKFYHLASFEYVADVQIVKGKLESEGIPVFLKDENTLNSDPLISNAIGGVKLQVYSKDKDLAIAIYNEIRAYAIDNAGNPIVCPNCKAQKSESYYNRKGVFYKLFPFFEKRKYKCLNCGIITNTK